MYFTSFHKAILNCIWEKRSPDSKSDFDLETFLEFYNKWYKKKKGKEIVAKLDIASEEHVFAGFLFDSGKSYVIKQKHEREVTLALKELDSLLKHLETNDLINIVDKFDSSESPESSALPNCIPLFIYMKDDGGENIQPFKTGLKMVKDYLGKKIQVREGYAKFRRFNYLTSDEKLRLIIAFWIPFIIALLKAIWDMIMKYINN